MKSQLAVVVLTICLITALPVAGQFVQDPFDLGVADTARVEFTLVPDAATNQMDVTLDVYCFNDGQTLGNISLGFYWLNDNLQMTDAYLSPEALAAFDFLKFLYRNNNIDTTNVHKQFQCVVGRLFGAGMAASNEAKLIASYEFTLSNWTVMDSVFIDTVQVLGAGFDFVDVANKEYRVFWPEPKVFYDVNRPILSNIVLSADTLFFDATQGGSNPAAQSVVVSSDQDQFAFDLFEDASWLLKSPSSGLTPQSVSVSVTTTGITAGLYLDSIRVTSGAVVNSPQFLFVVLDVAPPPPQIVANPSALFFNALVGGGNPVAQNINISNSGGGVLNWSVSTGDAWLSVMPTSGSGSGPVVVTADATGLSFGVYDGSITISDPSADNNPLVVPVQLSLATDLPVISVEPQSRYLVVNGYEAEGITRTFTVTNGGGGILAYGVEEHSFRIKSLSPLTSTAPDDVEVYFEFTQVGGFPEYSDTVWVVSDGAVNSPYPVVFHQRVALNPAHIELSTSNLELNVYECDQGYNQPLPIESFGVSNVGGDDPIYIELSYESEIFRVLFDDYDFAPLTVRVAGLRPDLPIGTYYDTLEVSARWADNKPQLVIIQVNYMAGIEPAEIIAMPSTIVVPYLQDSGPLLYEELEIFNVHGGCMAWTLEESLDWLSAVTPSGEVPGASSLLIDPSGYAIGEYTGAIQVTAPSAANSPVEISLTLQVWKLHGDVNWDGNLTPQDIALMIDYVFNGQHPPQPTLAVGDVNCDEQVNITDIALMIESFYETLVPLCGNPY